MEPPHTCGGGSKRGGRRGGVSQRTRIESRPVSARLDGGRHLTFTPRSYLRRRKPQKPNTQHAKPFQLEPAAAAACAFARYVLVGLHLFRASSPASAGFGHETVLRFGVKRRRGFGFSATFRSFYGYFGTRRVVISVGSLTGSVLRRDATHASTWRKEEAPGGLCVGASQVALYRRQVAVPAR
eukprot:164985-Prorocentrum_minimum.AAC.3